MNARKISTFVMAAAISMTSLATLAHAQAPSDPQIVGIVVAANQIDIDYAKIALQKSKNKEVREFAQQMMTDHNAVQKSVFDLGAKLKVTPAASDTQKSLKDGATKERAELRKLKGAAFDKAYIDNEVGYHQAVIDAVSKTLIPSAQNAELKQALVSTAPAFQGHLEHAKKLQGDLASGNSTEMHKH
jgi:putative membrane protein